METIGPAFVVVPDNMLANACPLLKIGRRIGTILLRPVLDRLSQTIEDLCARIVYLLDKFVGLSRNMTPLMATDAVDERLYAEDTLKIGPIGLVLSLLNLTLVGYGVAEVRNTRTSPLTLNLGLWLCHNG